MINIAINGFGRIGRRLCRLLLKNPKINIVAINDLSDTKTLSHLLKYDSVHGVCNESISYDSHNIIINGSKLPLSNFYHPKDIIWNTNSKIDFVVECTGKFKTEGLLNYHLKNNIRKVILSCPPSEGENIKTIVLGVNQDIIDGSEKIVSNASCTTNNAAPMLKIMKDNFSIKQAYITTIHSYTTDQSLHDEPHKDLRRARAAGQSIVPTTTGAAKALTKIFPELNNVIGGCGIRVPVINGSLTDITVNISEETSIEEINALFEVKNCKFKSLKYTNDPIVSVDVVGNPYSCVFDSQMTSVIGNMVKIVGWYDNESGYSNRIIDLISYLNNKISN
jgi:glyceraldehyde 3-phosphate dehydrogenase